MTMFFFYRKGKRYEAGHVAWMPDAFCLRNMVKRHYLCERKIFLSLSKCFLTFRAKVFKLGMAVRKYVTLDYTCIP